MRSWRQRRDTGEVNTSAPRIGLLLDVDGPVASPVSRSVRPSIIRNLVTLATAGWPVIFNTGRSDAFIREQVMQPMMAAGLPEGVRLHAVCEKGAVWFSFDRTGAGQPQVDPDLKVPGDYAETIRGLVAAKYSGTMFFDETKLAMVSVEQHVRVDNADYLTDQRRFDADALEQMSLAGMGAQRLEHAIPDARGTVAFRIDPTIISTDIEALGVGKDLGARRALSLLEAEGTPIPRIWRTVGDSRTDYAMADELHTQGYDVAHVDVRPADGVPTVPYPVLTAGSLIHDDAGAAYFERWVAMASGEATDDAVVV
ncbi:MULTISPECIES: hypothetical protein [unclassified Arthrobacter]|uniref:hypothetical protein n=1 Tax=unclassified Arthrobacter TaxID=235627 RepID=UPI001E3E373C|nr:MULTISPECIES: hypothetical protein [unclassified Arthrobacter]MCC9146777.1 hypothetical protein [Arthrobacter sp. zg-Y919]MDK1278008.1 hypothetical protein [Arthrobacter sp. zg.Y919]WIB04463.1 hypothetical protein QNO10_01535 [Arthrobacter sp. zg-Y919]